MSYPTLRKLILLQSIPREPRFISSQDLQSRMEAAGYTVSLRTIQRDLQSLSLHFPLIQNEPLGRGKLGMGWAFSQDARYSALPGMDSVMALTMSMAMQYLQTLLPQQVVRYLEPLNQEAEKQLNQHNSAKFQDWVSKVRVISNHYLKAPEIDAKSMELVYLALLENQQLKVTYKGKKDTLLHPYGLIQQGHTLYLVCRFYNFDDVRVTALHRFKKVELLTEKVRPFPEFNIDDYLDKGGLQWLVEDKKIDLKIEVANYLAQVLEETPITPEQTISPSSQENHSLVTAQVFDSMPLRRWLLSQGSSLVVLEPENLRQGLKKQLEELVGKYSS